jgi:hypothetical protein
MLGLILAVLVGIWAKRLWPSGVIFLLVISAASLGLKVAFSNQTRSGFGEPLIEPTPTQWAASFAATLAIYATIFLVAFFIAKWARSGRSKS